MLVIRYPPMKNQGEPQSGTKEEVATAQTVLPDSEFSISHTASSSQVATHSIAPGQVNLPVHELYELEETLGEGGMGAVYAAQDRSLHRTVAVKVMHARLAEKPMLLRRFFKEAQIAAQLEHPGIVPTYSLNQDEKGQARLAMRLIRGNTLETTIERAGEKLGRGPGSLTRLHDRLELFLRAADAVHFAHKKGVVHRDIKPENIMVGPHRDAYVMDWGLATLNQDDGGAAPGAEEMVEVDDDPKATQFGELMGTVAYMAPEQAMGNHALVGAAADQFALGMTLQELITLSSARTGPNLTAAVTKAVMGEREAMPEWVPAGLAAIVAKSTAKEPAERYASVKALAQDVRRYLRDEELEVMPDPLVRRLWRILSRYQSAALIGSLLLVTAVAGLVVSHVWRERGRREAQIAHAEFVAQQLSLVGARASTVNARARGVENELARLTGAAKHVLRSRPPQSMPILRPGALEGPDAPADTKHLERYNQKVTFERAVIVTAPEPGPGFQADELRLAAMEPDFIKGMESGGFVKGADRTERSAPLQWIYLGTPSGVLINYPGAGGFKKDYDSRTRPWFKTPRSDGPVWGKVYGDATGSGTLLPCNRAIFGPNDQLLGVVGIDFQLADIERALALPELKGYQDAWLLNEKLEVVGRAPGQIDAAGESSASIQAHELVEFQVAEVRAAILARPSSGQRVLNQTRYLYSGIPALGWTYVVAAKVR